MPPLTILHLITELNVGGAEHMLYKIVSHSNKSNFRHLVVSMTDRGPFGNKIMRSGIRVYELRMKAGYPDPRAILRLVHLLKAISVDILQTWLYHADLLGFIAGKISRVPKIVWGIRCSEMKLEKYRKLTFYTMHVCSMLSSFVDAIAVNSYAGMKAHINMGYDRRKMTVIPNGFDTSLFRPDFNLKKSFKSELGLKNSDILIGMVARFDPMKDHQTFLRAAALLARQDKRIHFALIGKGMEPGNKKLMSVISPILENRLHLLGQRDDMPRVMNGIDILTNSSFGEGFSNVIGEAMASGTICIVTDVGDSAHIVGDTGFVIKPSEPAELFNAWESVLQLEDRDLKRLGEKARSRIMEFFTLDTSVTRFETFYHELFNYKNRALNNNEN